MKFFNFINLIALAIIVTSCSTATKVVKTPQQPQESTIHLSLVDNPQADKYANLEYGIRLNVQDSRSDKRMIQVYDAVATSKPIVNVYPDVNSFIPEGIRRYMRTMGFNMDADVATDYSNCSANRLKGIAYSEKLRKSLQIVQIFGLFW